MRPLRFRAWDKKRKAWLPGGYGFNLLGESLNIGGLFGGLPLERWNDMEIMQFTGMTDQGGQDIYEGDIIQYQRTVSIIGLDSNLPGQQDLGERIEPESFLGVVEWRTPTFWCDGMLSIHANIEIIGNLHEHPHLLPTAGRG